MPSIVMTLIGNDRPGLVDSLSATILQHGANWTESRMAHLAGQFAGILRVEVLDENRDALIAALERLDEIGLKVILQKDDASAQSATGPVVHLELVGNDRPGIVRDVSHVLSDLQVNVEEISTECRPSPMSGGELFHATARLQLPADRSVSELRSRLEAIAADLMVDMTLSES